MAATFLRFGVFEKQVCTTPHEIQSRGFNQHFSEIKPIGRFTHACASSAYLCLRAGAKAMQHTNNFARVFFFVCVFFNGDSLVITKQGM